MRNDEICINVLLYFSDETICKRVLNRSVRRLIEDLDVITVLDYSIEKEFLSSVECRDIKVCFYVCHWHTSFVHWPLSVIQNILK
jgi:hypothetical protein